MYARSPQCRLRLPGAVRTGALALLLLPAGAWAAAGDKPKDLPDPMGVGGIAQVGLALFVVLLLILGMAWLLRRFGRVPGSSGGPIRIVGGVSMGQRERIVLVQVGETQVLVGVAPGRVQTLHVLDEPVALGGPDQGGSFAAKLNQALGRGGSQ